MIMSKRTYQATPGKESKTAKAILANANVSLKYSTEIFNQIKGQPVNKVILYMERVKKHEDHVPLRKYNKKVAHRKGEAKQGVKSGRYPEKVVVKFKELLELVKNNADFKGLDTEKLIILTGFASQGFKRQNMQSKGKIGGKVRYKKSTHLEVVVSEASL